MPPKAKVTKPEIIQASVDLVRENGASALNARSLASKLGISTQPIFSNYTSMDALKEEVISAAGELYQSFIAQDIQSGNYPAYKASGMAYIRFAKEETELFKLLFMRDRSDELITENAEELKPILQLIQANTGLDEQHASLFHLEMWITVHGIATMIATSYLELDWDMISRILTDSYEGLKTRFCGKDEK